MENPFEQFKAWWTKALDHSPLNQKSAVCVSTINKLGFPDARFVDLKSVANGLVTFCTSYDSAKGQHLSANPKIALTAWWDHVGLQIRVVGTATKITDSQADEYWQARSRDAQLTTSCFQQSAGLSSESALEPRLQQSREEYQNQQIPRPVGWGGYHIQPVSMEFLTFRESRLHLRELFTNENNRWQYSLLQP